MISVATSHSVHLSLDAGRTWHARLQLPAGTEITALAVRHPMLVLAGTSTGLMGSFDGGKRWKRLLKKSTGCQAVTAHADTAMASCGSGLLVSRDGGRRWQEVTPPSITASVHAIALDPSSASRAYVLTASSLFAGDLDQGLWDELYTEMRAEDEAVEEPNVEHEIGETNGSLHHLSAVALDPAEPGTMFLSSTSGILTSRDRGDTWQWMPDRGLPATAINRLFLQRSSPLTVYAATANAVAAWPDHADRWTLLPTPGTAINDLAVDGQNAWVATEQGLYQVPLPAGGFPETPLPSAHELLSNFVHEPTVAQVREAAIRYAEVHPEKIKRWRRQASLEAFMPTLSFGYDSDTATNNQIDEGTFPNFQQLQTVDRDSSLDASVNWDLGELIWNNDQTSIDVRSKLMVELRDDIVDEVTRAYFDRRRLQVELMTRPPTDPQAHIDKELQLQELTARLDGLTGGYFSAHTGIHE